MIKITVVTDDEGRIDKALARHYPDAGRRQLLGTQDRQQGQQGDPGQAHRWGERRPGHGPGQPQGEAVPDERPCL